MTGCVKSRQCWFEFITPRSTLPRPSRGLNRENLVVPEWSKRPDLWRQAFEVVKVSPLVSSPCFIHHDYQQFNLLWRQGKLSSVVDWVWGSMGSPGLDVAHLRLNFSVLYSSELAQQFLDLYESMSGRVVERWWDVEGLLLYLPGWGGFCNNKLVGDCVWTSKECTREWKRRSSQRYDATDRATGSRRRCRRHSHQRFMGLVTRTNHSVRMISMKRSRPIFIQKESAI